LSEPIQIDRVALLLAAIVESSDDAIVSKDLNGIVTSWNKAAERIFGWPAPEIIGRSILTIIPPELHSDEDIILSNIRSGQRIEHFETVRLRKDGERINVSLTISPVKDRNGQIVGAAKIARDITQQKNLQAALQVSERLAAMGRLAATVAHEINNPLEAVTNFIYLARHIAKQQRDCNRQLTQYLDAADHELARVAHIARQTLGFYRDSTQPGLVDINKLVDDVLGIYQQKLRSRWLRIEKSISSGLIVFLSQGELKQVVSNLLANAIDASREGGRICIRARHARHRRTGAPGLRLTIADTGGGIPVSQRRRIFQPFFTTKKELGTGLGLWITRDLVEKKGGSIRFRSRDVAPSGTVMSLFLPAAAAAAAADLAA
jgi:PAS domain S-box-containing protein